MIQSHLGTLESSGLVRLAQLDPELEYLFRHALVQDAAYDSLLRQDRRRLHLAVAEVLESLYADRLDELAGTLAQHFDAAGDKRAFAYYLRAGDVAASQYANVIAIEHYRQALEKGRQSPVDEGLLLHLCRMQGRLLELTIQHDAALRHYETMASWAEEVDSPALRLLALTEQAKIYATVASWLNVERGQRLAEEALGLARQVGDHEMEAKALWCMMWVHMYNDQRRQALQYGEQSLGIARRFDLRERLAYVLNDLFYLSLELESREKASQRLAEAQALWRELGNLPMLTDNLIRSGSTLYGCGDYLPALRQLEEANEISRATGNLWGQIDSQRILGYLHLALGHVDKALAIVEETFAPAQAAGLSEWQAQSHSTQAWIYITIGAFEHALKQIEQVRVAVDRLSEMARERQLYLLIRGYVRASCGEVEQAESDIHEAEQELLRLAQGERPLPNALLVIAKSRIAMVRGEYAQIIPLVDALFDDGRTIGTRSPAYAVALYLKGQALMAQGMLEDARASMEATLVRAQGMPWLLAPVLASLSQVEAQAGDTAKAHSRRQEASAQIELLLPQLSPELRAAFLRQPVIQTVIR